MIVKADIPTIDYLVTVIEKMLPKGFRESSKNEPIYIIVDYYDWLRYMFTMGSKKKVDFLYGAEFFSSIYKQSESIIELTDYNFNSDRAEKLYSEFDPDSLMGLLRGYKFFVRELENIQLTYMKNYVYNNNNHPKLFIPFSYGINRIAVEHYLFSQVYDKEFGYMTTNVYQYDLNDRCKRVKANLLGSNCLIGTITNHIDTSETIILPEVWKINSNKSDGTSLNVLGKHKALTKVYSNYRNVGLFGEDTFLKDKYPQVFLLNQPFTIPEDVNFPTDNIQSLKSIENLTFIGKYPK